MNTNFEISIDPEAVEKIVIRQEDFYYALEYDIKPVNKGITDILKEPVALIIDDCKCGQSVYRLLERCRRCWFVLGDVNKLITYFISMNLKSVTLEVLLMQHVVTRGQEY